MEILAEHLVVEAALGQPAVERRLAALEAVKATPERAVWPLPPRPLVLPLPEPMPRPTRLAR